MVGEWVGKHSEERLFSQAQIRTAYNPKEGKGRGKPKRRLTVTCLV